MTTDPSGARPGKIAGIALIGVAAVATVLGVVTLLGGNGDSAADQTPSNGAPPSSAAPATTTEAQTTTAPPATTSSAAPTTTTTTAPTSSDVATATPVQPGPGPTTRAHGVRIYNNSKETGLAAKAKSDLEQRGWQVVEVGNYSQGIIPVTTVYFRPGTDEEAGAQELAKEFGIRAEPRFDGIADASPGLILIVTNNYAGPGKE